MHEWDNAGFEESVRPTIMNILLQRPVTPTAVNDLSMYIHLVCDMKHEHRNLAKQFHLCIQEAVREKAAGLPVDSDDLTLLRAYTEEYIKFTDLSEYMRRSDLGEHENIPLAPPKKKEHPSIDDDPEKDEHVPTDDPGHAEQDPLGDPRQQGPVQEPSTVSHVALSNPGWNIQINFDKQKELQRKRLNQPEKRVHVRLNDVHGDILLNEESGYNSLPFAVLGRVMGTGEIGIRNIMLRNWHDIVFKPLQRRLILCARMLIQSERSGEVPEPRMIVAVKNSCADAVFGHRSVYEKQTYTHDYEQVYLNDVENFYYVHARLYLEANGPRKYIRYADKKITEEIQRGHKYLKIKSYAKERYYHTDLKTRCKQSLVFNYKEEILGGCPEIIEKYDAEALRIYMEEFETPLFLQTLQEELERFIIYHGISDQKKFLDIIHEEPEIYVEKLLELFRRIKKMVQFCNNDPRLIAPMRKAFETIVDTTRYFSLELCIELFSTDVIESNSSQKWSRKYESRCPEFLAHFCNVLLSRNAFSKLSSEEIELKLKDAISFLTYVKNKDVFMASYKALLTRRLIHRSSSDSLREQDVIIWMRNSGMPLDYINQLRTIFRDIKFSEVFTEQFKDHHQNDNTIPDFLNVTILNCDASTMDTEQSLVSLPQELGTIVSKVDYFYNQVHNSGDELHQRGNRRRYLKWHHHLSYGTVIFRNDKGKFEFDVTTYQMIVLLVWNQKCLQFKFKELEEITKLPQKELRKTLWSLVAFSELNHQVLLYLPMVNSEKDFDANTLFWVNEDFCIVKKRKTRIRGKVNLIGRHLLFSEKCKEVESKTLVLQRTLRTRRAISQIMRIRDLSYTVPLHMELVGILKNMFTPPSLLVKDQIEWLIEMHSLQRDHKHSRLLCYLYPLLQDY